MHGSPTERFGLGARELVAIVGAGGKTTILHTLGRELAGEGHKVVLTTTTRMAPDQVTGPVCWSTDPSTVEAAFVPGAPLFVLSGRDAGKVAGLTPAAVDRLFSTARVDHLVVEADGARTMSIKAPAAHEPVIPPASTTVVVVMGADALGRPFGEVAHRIERITALTGLTADDTVTPERAAAILLHREGGLKSVPPQARVVVAITKVTAADEQADGQADEQAVGDLVALVAGHDRVDRCVRLYRHPDLDDPIPAEPTDPGPHPDRRGHGPRMLV